ncbi:hypothetical protein PHET_03477 [Paragonimus heterotremus]|uniref:RRM domain-containing protein n=1 Tax=Paragonimus heterotremus TaxID=100268 RepID=A0A8J4THC6_9TREM|nr:hypothetical protein PHET_03477 [Paragonimus heterotremus]
MSRQFLVNHCRSFNSFFSLWLASPVTLKATPQRGTPVGKTSADSKQLTPGKLTTKRPLPSGSESEEDEDQTVGGLSLNGLPKNKKGRFTLTSQESFASDDDEVSDEDDDDSEESDDGEGNAGDGDEDDDEEDDDDDSVEEDDEEEDVDGEPGSSSFLQSPAVAEVKASQSLSTSPDGKNVKNSVVQVKQSPKGKSVITPESAEYLVIPNAPKDMSKIKKALLERGQVVCDTRLLTGPFAIVSVASFVDAKKLLEADKPFSVDGTTMQFVRLDGSKDAIARLLLGNTTKSIFVTGIPKSITVELLKSKLPASCVPTGSRLLSTGPKNKFFNAAYLNFDSNESAAEAFQVLSNVKLDNHALRVTFAKEVNTSEVHVSGDLRGKTKCIMACQLPPNVTESQLKSLFSNAIKFKILEKQGETVCYINFRDETAAVEAFDAHNNSHLGKSKLILRFVPFREDTDVKFQADVSGIPDGVTVQQILDVFPGATGAFQCSQGNYTLHFPSNEVRRTAVAGKKTLKNKLLTVSIYGGFDRNMAFVRNIPFDADEGDVRSVYSDASKVEIHRRPDGRSTGTATLTFSTAADCESAMHKRSNLKGRPLFACLKRVIITSEEVIPKPIPKAKLEKQSGNLSAQTKAPPQVGSGSEGDENDDEGDDDDENDDDNDDDSDDDDDTDEGDESEDGDGDSDDVEGEGCQPKQKEMARAREEKTKAASGSDNEDEEMEEDEDESDDGDDDEDDDTEGSEDEGIEDASDEEAPSGKGQNNYKVQKKNHGPPNRGHKDGSKGDRDFQSGNHRENQRGGFKNRGNGGGNRGFRGGGGRGSNRGFGGGRGFGSGGGGNRGFGGGRGFRGRGGQRGKRGN